MAQALAPIGQPRSSKMLRMAFTAFLNCWLRLLIQPPYCSRFILRSTVAKRTWVLSEGIEVSVAQDRHHGLVAFFDRAIEPLECGIEFPKPEVYMSEACRKNVTFSSLKLFHPPRASAFLPHTPKARPSHPRK